MKKITLLLLLFVSSAFYAQSTGISYQAIIYNPNGEVIPGYNNSNSPLANKDICLQFTIVDSANLTEYQEKITVRTDEFGMVNTVIGTGTRTGGYATSFGNINWSFPNKSMKVGLDTFGLCTNFIEISNQFFTGVPYSFNAFRADNVTGIVQIQNGGTGANSVIGAKTNLGLENVDNTRDINKPISIATQAALNLKEDLSNKSTNVATDAASNTKYPSVKAVKDYVDTNINLGGTALTNEANIRAAADLLKEDLINKSTNVTTDGASNTKYPSVKAVKDYVDSSINLGGTALTNEANIRAAADLALNNALNTEITSRINFDLLKEDVANKSSNVTTDASSTTKYPSVRAIKTYVDASDSSLTTNLNAEVAARIAGDNSLIANISAEVSRATSVDNTLTNNLLQELTRATAAENALSSTVTTNAATAAAATALKENSANKSTDVTLSDATNVKFPTELAVKTYVNNQIASGTATNVSGVVAIANGGTGSSTQNFVDLTTAQTVSGVKTFSNNLVVNGTLTTGNITYPTSAGTNGQVLTSNGSGAATWTTLPASPKFVRSFTQTFNNFVNCTAQSEVSIGNLTFSILPTSATNGAGVKLVVKSSTTGDYQCVSYLGNTNDNKIVSVSTTNQNVSDLVLNYYSTLTSTIFQYYNDGIHSYEVKATMDGGQSVLLVVTYY